VEERMQQIKNTMRQGAGSEDFDQLGVLLHGYAALQKVYNKDKQPCLLTINLYRDTFYVKRRIQSINQTL